MFCFQCQETARNKGCTVKGVCGKTAEVADLQDNLIFVTKGLAQVKNRIGDLGDRLEEVDGRIADNLFTTITNANFSAESIEKYIDETLNLKEELMESLDSTEDLPLEATFDMRKGISDEERARYIGVMATEDEDIRSLRELITYGLKGMAAYTRHANVLGLRDEDVKIRSSGNNGSFIRAAKQSRYFNFRPRSRRYGSTFGTNEGHRRRRIHPFGNASRQLLSRL